MAERPPILDVYPYHGRRLAEAKGLRRLFYRLLPIPLHAYIPLRAELHALRVRLTSFHIPWRYRNAENLLVNLGSGPYGKAGWVNVDIESHDGVNCVCDCRKRLPFPDESATGIFCEHFLEHLDYTEEAPSFLTECHRVLNDGGVIRLVVPDAARYLEGYVAEGWDALEELRSMGESRMDPSFDSSYDTKMELINAVFRQGHQHKFGYDFDTLDRLLRKCGFASVHRQEFGRSLMSELSIDQERRAPESLYVEAVK